MSTGNDNFITLDSIAEIQDIVNGDYIFTISNGVIYKLDFQNFIISRENTDFFTTIDTLSAQVVTNTQSLCSINAYINDTIKPNFGKLDSIYSTLNELSAIWDSTYTTINTLSSQAFLPISTDSNNIQAGSMVFYDGENSRFNTLAPGGVGEILNIQNNGLPGFQDVSETNIGAKVLKSGTNITNLSNLNTGEITTNPVSYILFSSDSTKYKNVRVALNLNTVDKGYIPGPGRKGPVIDNTMELKVNGVNVPITNGIGVISTLNISESIIVKITFDGTVPSGARRTETLHYTVTGFEDNN